MPSHDGSGARDDDHYIDIDSDDNDKDDGDDTHHPLYTTRAARHLCSVHLSLHPPIYVVFHLPTSTMPNSFSDHDATYTGRTP